MIIHKLNGLKNFEYFDSFATCGSDGILNVWNDKTKEKTFSYSNRNNIPVTAFNFSIDGKYCIIALGNDHNHGCYSPIINPILVFKIFDDKEKSELKNIIRSNKYSNSNSNSA